jgi:hypothetical protein
MAGPDMSHAAHGPALGGAVADYLAAVAAQLRGPATARAQITDELRDGLLEAAEAYRVRGPWLALPLVGLALAVAWVSLGLTVAASGRLGRRLGGWLDRGVLPSTAAAVAGLAAVLVDLTLLAIMGGHTLATAGSLAWGPVVVAAGASLARATLAGLAARRCLVTRATLT